MNKMADRITDGPADNWPGDATDEDFWEERRRRLKALSNDGIRDMVADAMTDEMCEVIRRHFVNVDAPKVPEKLAVGSALGDRFAVELERYLEAEE